MSAFQPGDRVLVSTEDGVAEATVVETWFTFDDAMMLELDGWEDVVEAAQCTVVPS